MGVRVSYFVIMQTGNLEAALMYFCTVDFCLQSRRLQHYRRISSSSDILAGGGGGAANLISVPSVESATCQIYDYFSQHTIHNKATDINQFSKYFSFSAAQQPTSGVGGLIVEVSRSQTDPHSRQ
jgi:hypothetical protein